MSDPVARDPVAHDPVAHDPVRVLLVDDQTLFRRGLASLLAWFSTVRVVGEAADGEEAWELLATLEIDVLLLDVRMPRLDGVGLLQRLRAADRLPPTILLTTFDDDEALLAGMRAGARGFLLKDVDVERLAAAILRVAAGESLIRPAVTERVMLAAAGIPPAFERVDSPERLTRREAEVLRLIAAGLANREIADALGTSEGTVKNQTSSILGKLGVRDRTRAVLRALELGLL